MKAISPVPSNVLLKAEKLGQTRAGANGAQPDKLRKVCSDFESLFINQMLQTMRKSIPDSGLLEGGVQKDIYTSLFDEQLSKKMAEGKGMGLGEMLYKNLKQAYERQQAEAASQQKQARSVP